MSKTASHVRDSGVVSERTPSPEEVRRQLRNILASPAFHGSKRCQQFLEYVCGKFLEGELGALKERTIAVEVFGRSPESDLAEDTIVRVGAREVRKRLAQYYVTPEGAAADVRIDLHPGSYAPEFRFVTNPHEEEVAPPVALVIEEPPAVRPSHRRRWVLAGALTLVAVASLTAVKLWVPASPEAAAFQLFWEPVLRSSEPMLVAVAHPMVYHASRRAMKLSAEGRPIEEIQTQHPIRVAPDKLNGDDLIPVLNQYVGFGDMVAANEVSGMLVRQGKPPRLRLASNVGFEDLRNTNTFLIGAITNQWTMESQQAWRFRFRRTAEFRTDIFDTQVPGQEWTIASKEDGSSPEDYILVCRIRNSFTGGLLLVAAGLKQFGTEAAGRLLADPAQLGVILRKLPAGWETRNLQFVLHARVIGNAPALPQVVASHVW